MRLDDAKRNMAPAAKASWFQLRSVKLGNTFDPTYPNGDSVGAIVAWQPPDDELATAPNAELNAALDAIRRPRARYPLHRVQARAVLRSMVRPCPLPNVRTTEKQATKMINDWLKSGLLYVTEYRHPKFRKNVPGVAVNDTH